MVHKIRHTPPDSKFVPNFIKLCILTTCFGTNFMKAYINIQLLKDRSYYEPFKLYSQQNFYMEVEHDHNYYQFASIGDLILCGIPDDFCKPLNIIGSYRGRLKAQNEFEADIDNAALTHERKCLLRKSMEDPYRKYDRQNAKLSGWILCYVLLACLKGKEEQFPNLHFLNKHTKSLTPEQKDEYHKIYQVRYLPQKIYYCYYPSSSFPLD